MLNKIQIANLRNITTQQIDGLSEVNVFLGENGAGKTSVLEAIHTLGYGRSFRKQGGQKDALVQYGRDRLVVFGERQTSSKNAHPESNTITSVDRLGLSRGVNGEIQIKLNGEKLHRLSDMALRLPAIALNSDTFDLLTGGSAERRRYVDWAVFHVEHRFRDTTKRFLGALQQRNSILRRFAKTGAAPDAAALEGESTNYLQEDKELDVWTQAVAELGSQLEADREQQFGVLNQLFCDVLEELGGGALGLKLSYRRGWSQGITLREALEQSLLSDLSRGFTQVGPHRADLQVAISKDVAVQPRLARDVLSRGQLKLVVLAMKLAQVRFYQCIGKRPACGPGLSDDAVLQSGGSQSDTVSLLLDDVGAEFDSKRILALGRVLAAMVAQGGVQVFATTTSQDVLEPLFDALSAGSPKVFHVEQGVVSALE
jgi:DNA replication and repair protein RecF